ncbi:MAG: hypothetical protein QOJ42_3802, partial [Acidobacteriaceae bacterium]|nr:hypothetical protein [Acidobacteriaceae bacterium]
VGGSNPSAPTNKHFIFNSLQVVIPGVIPFLLYLREN